MLVNPQTDALPSIDRVGDVVGVQFSDEDELALFIPGSGDVLLCRAGQWRCLKDASVDSAQGLLPGPGVHSEGDAPGVDLKTVLLNLGACLA